jgi:hypothetical protein
MRRLTPALRLWPIDDASTGRKERHGYAECIREALQHVGLCEWVRPSPGREAAVQAGCGDKEPTHVGDELGRHGIEQVRPKASHDSSLETPYRVATRHGVSLR